MQLEVFEVQFVWRLGSYASPVTAGEIEIFRIRLTRYSLKEHFGVRCELVQILL